MTQKPPLIYRVQDAQGRGPFRPGFTEKWITPGRDLDALPPWFSEFDICITEMSKNYHLGCGCRTKIKLGTWFSYPELIILQNNGYRICEIQPDIILAESDIQTVFATKDPLNTFYNSHHMM